MLNIVNKGNSEFEDIDIEDMPVIVQIPKDTSYLTIEAVVTNADGETMTLKCSMPPSQIHKARQDFLDNVKMGDEYDAIYTLTEEGKQWLEENLPQNYKPGL